MIASKDASVQCSILPAPPLSFHGTPNCRLEREIIADLDINEATTESDDSSSGTDYMPDSNDDAIVDE